jgi:hypothetical protein
MIKPGIYTIEAVEKYHSILLTGEDLTGALERRGQRGIFESVNPKDKSSKEIIKDREAALKELEATVEDPATDPYYLIRENGRRLNRLMKQIVLKTDDKTDDVFIYPTPVFEMAVVHAGYRETQAAIEECYASCEKLKAVLDKIPRKEEQMIDKEVITHSKSNLDILVGKVITDVELYHAYEKYDEEDEIMSNKIDFYTDCTEKFQFRCMGECCPRTWIESLDGLEYLIGEKVTSIVEKVLGDILGDITVGEYDYVELYSIDIVTRKGTCTIDFRNSNSGYGGWLELVKDE